MLFLTVLLLAGENRAVGCDDWSAPLTVAKDAAGIAGAADVSIAGDSEDAFTEPLAPRRLTDIRMVSLLFQSEGQGERPGRPAPQALVIDVVVWRSEGLVTVKSTKFTP